MSATCTAHITAGNFNRWGGPGVGIGPDWIMYLVEGSRAAWVLETVAHHVEESDRREPRTWVASRPDRILADALVMIAALVEEDPEVLITMRDRLPSTQTRSLLEGDFGDLTEAEPEVVADLETAAQRAVHAKLVVTVMNGSSITGQLALLDRCSMDVEVCTVSWIRQRDGEDRIHVAGDLPPEDPDAHRFGALRIL